MEMYQVEYYTINHGEKIYHTHLLSARSAADACCKVKRAVVEMASTHPYDLKAYPVK